MKYAANRGGHAGGHLRDAFLEYLDGSRTRNPKSGDMVQIDDEPHPLRWLVGQLWNCTDVMPGLDCDTLDLPAGSTYAQGAREISRRLKRLSQ